MVIIKVKIGVGAWIPLSFYHLEKKKIKIYSGSHTANFSLAIRILRKQHTENKASTLIMQARFWSSNHHAILLSLKSAMDTPCLIIVLNS